MAAEHLVTVGHRRQRRGESRHVEPSTDAEGEGHVVGGGSRRELLHEPHAPLRERGGRLRVISESRNAFIRCGRIARAPCRIDARRHAGEIGLGQHPVDAQRHAEVLADPRGEQGGLQGIAPRAMKASCRPTCSTRSSSRHSAASAVSVPASGLASADAADTPPASTCNTARVPARKASRQAARCSLPLDVRGRLPLRTKITAASGRSKASATARRTAWASGPGSGTARSSSCTSTASSPSSPATANAAP